MLVQSLCSTEAIGAQKAIGQPVMRARRREAIYCHAVALNRLPDRACCGQVVIEADGELLHLQAAEVGVTIHLVLEVGQLNDVSLAPQQPITGSRGRRLTL